MLNFMMGRAARVQPANRLTPQDAVTKAAAGEITVIDVRDHNEVANSGKAEGAVHIPLAVLNFQADPKGPDFNKLLAADKPIAVYCASGGRSGMAAQVLSNLGYDEVHNIGGLGHWQMAGGKITR
ncbi:rhodanese-like domain-containing protein [Aliiroseovarius subalbicans]|uniref:rhodanese-like domain-containing protein n=1 Tax=Aliiroseovarius subalbicans TaxID=2925840 RepID=UPI001F58C066|nr:rhodanese-like domain-containing protein [Aliiroseovarius subalbicans]MCI2398490.1 sulfurtransferase [Aliiroseovarius subalbicans]